MAPVRFDHIAIAMARMADAPAVLVGELGGLPEAGGWSGDFRWGCWRFDGGGRIEIIEPAGGDGFLHRFLARRGPGIHHVTFTVPSLRAACDRAQAHGYQVVGYDDSDPEWATAYLHPKQALGIVVQLAQSSAKGEPRPWVAPPGPTNPPPPVTVLGLRMRAHSPERARVQWESVLEGEASPGPVGELVFRWPASPMRLVVVIDPSLDEGPIAIELGSRRAVSLPEGSLPLLGTAFVRLPYSGAG